MQAVREAVALPLGAWDRLVVAFREVVRTAKGYRLCGHCPPESRDGYENRSPQLHSTPISRSPWPLKALPGGTARVPGTPLMARFQVDAFRFSNIADGIADGAVTPLATYWLKESADERIG